MVYHLENTTSKLAITNPQTPMISNNNNNTSMISNSIRMVSNNNQNNTTTASINNSNATKMMKPSMPSIPSLPSMATNFAPTQWNATMPSFSSSTVVSNMEYLPSSMRATELEDNSPQDKNKVNRVKVVVRIRPPISEDASSSLGEFVDCTTISREKKTLLLRRNSYEERDFNYDHVLDQSTTQEQMYQTVAENVVNVCYCYFVFFTSLEYFSLFVGIGCTQGLQRYYISIWTNRFWKNFYNFWSRNALGIRR